jgi:hypothetical protein
VSFSSPETTGPVLVQDSTFTDEVLAHASAWTSGTDVMAVYLSAIAAAFEEVYTLVMPFGDPEDQVNFWPSWAVLLDPTNCPTNLLPFLSQFNGTAVPPGTSDAVARQQIRTEASMYRGTVAAMVQAAQNQLTGTQQVLLRERTSAAGTPDPYHVILTYNTGQCQSPAALIAAVEAQKPAGIQISYVGTAGYTWNESQRTWNAETMTWSQTLNTQP